MASMKYSLTSNAYFCSSIVQNTSSEYLLSSILWGSVSRKYVQRSAGNLNSFIFLCIDIEGESVGTKKFMQTNLITLLIG